ncbi:hypothetical protein MMC06_005232 [Schaereria dolodes]|nr:hypothetical protein [Schaereria dolodes]
MCIGSVDGGILRGQDNELALNGKSAEENILWINPGKTVGIRIRIHERKWRHDGPILVHKDEEIAVSYVMEYEELLIRTTHLLLAVEQNLSQLSNISGKAMVFGAFASR